MNALALNLSSETGIDRRQSFPPVDFVQKTTKPDRRVGVAIIDGDSRLPELLADSLARAEQFKCAGLHHSGESALASLPASKPGMILMEINLPDMSGMECIRRLKPMLPDTQFVVLTSSDAPEHVFNALAAGASGYLLKRMPCDQLVGALSNIQLCGSLLNRQIAGKILRSFQPWDSRPSISGKLSVRQVEVLELLAKGLRFEQIASRMNVSLETVKTHARRLYKNLQVQSRSQAVSVYTQNVSGAQTE